MTKSEIKKATDSALIVDYTKSYARMVLNTNTPERSEKRISQHCRDLEAELVARGILSENDVKYLSM